MPVTSVACKQSIVDWLRVPPLTQEQIDDARDVANWELTSTVAEGGNIVREFDCRKSDDTLRGYVYSDISDCRIVEVCIQED